MKTKIMCMVVLAVLCGCNGGIDKNVSDSHFSYKTIYLDGVAYWEGGRRLAVRYNKEG